MNRSATAHRIADATQQRILAAAAALRYKPNVFASGLRNKRSFIIGVLVPEISEGYPTAILGGVEDVLLQQGFFYFIVSHRHREELLYNYPQLLVSRAVEGIIAVDSPLEDDLPVPVVAISGNACRSATIHIELDHEVAARLALEHLQKLGHRHIGFIKGQGFSSDTHPRWKAILSAARSMGIAVVPELTVQLRGAGPGTQLGYAATLRLLARNRPFSAIFAFNDLAAIGAITALHDAGIHVPKEVSVVGFDDIHSASIHNPALTTVRQPLSKMGRIAATTLLDLIQKGEPLVSQRSIQVMPDFRKRQSTCSAPKSMRQWKIDINALSKRKQMD
jgi:DNA-binding LacI/PurR family transcriptional regulator